MDPLCFPSVQAVASDDEQDDADLELLEFVGEDDQGLEDADTKNTCDENDGEPSTESLGVQGPIGHLVQHYGLVGRLRGMVQHHRTVPLPVESLVSIGSSSPSCPAPLLLTFSPCCRYASLTC